MDAGCQDRHCKNGCEKLLSDFRSKKNND